MSSTEDAFFEGGHVGAALRVPSMSDRTNRPKKGAIQMTDQSGPTAHVPLQVSLFSPVLKLMLSAGIPLGPNALVTIRGRKSGVPRTAAVAIIEISGRRWVWAPWGEVHWVRNLRAAGRATIRKRHRTEEVIATELDPAQRVEFFRDIYGPYAQSLPFGATFIRMIDGVDLNHPAEIAVDRRVFELHPVTECGRPGRNSGPDLAYGRRSP
jgi:deazaflavin-dependent oxidoreductase (nitroreductase family)